ncbi:MAG: type I-C CRISPR-associated protein Cas8c/Csd1 [Gammaproteobacteria bacterium]|nr:type I-C CRISPR-associated protein Cas8c/Csd1 [Gammaproteobacteria bacterium]MBU1655678.1 type I-C CRISPR-associated protein Cas8c/Csd1 [Gammaproteobacteria bacterium]MBU1962363.1 type I-C CRISPR-associated protein Cas8c/Csd1 [Gammaproteobacteria bacterium]
MILQSLSHYYQRKASGGENELAPFGFERKGIEFMLLLDREGTLINIEDIREQQGKKKVAREYLMPQGVKKTSGIAANLLWDNAEYVLGLEQKGKPERTEHAHVEFMRRIRTELGELDDEGIQAVLRFLEVLDLSHLESFPAWPELRESTGNLSFRLQGDPGPVCQRPGVVKAIEQAAEIEGNKGICLVSGDHDEPLATHPAIKGVWGAQSSGANIVSFNLDAFRSWGKEQGHNAPVGKHAAFAYTTALNHLLRSDSHQRFQIGDTSTIFWADRATQVETDLPDWLREPPSDDPDRNTVKIKALYESVRKGGFSPDDDKNRFYVLGLAPNAARIAIRFWEVGTVADISRRIVQHFDDLAIDRSPNDPPYPSLFRLLVHVAVLGKADNIPPNIGGDFMRAVLGGLPYPYTLLQAAIRRNRAERRVDCYRAALTKACLNRRHRANPSSSPLEKEINVSLDKSRTEIGYRLGRLFAVLEKVQEDAQPGINATIRDRYYGAASSSPLSVFSTLMKLKNHHLSKLENPRYAARYEKLFGEILDGIEAFPAQMPLTEQGLFAIGYYHQRQDFYTKHDKETTETQGEQA